MGRSAFVEGLVIERERAPALLNAAFPTRSFCLGPTPTPFSTPFSNRDVVSQLWPSSQPSFASRSKKKKKKKKRLQAPGAAHAALRASLPRSVHPFPFLSSPEARLAHSSSAPSDADLISRDSSRKRSPDSTPILSSNPNPEGAPGACPVVLSRAIHLQPTKTAPSIPGRRTLTCTEWTPRSGGLWSSVIGI